MKTLFISNDPLIFDATSAVRARMREYASRMEELHIISRAPLDAVEEQDGTLFLHPYLGGKLAAQLLMPPLARALILARGIQVVSAQDPFEYGRIAVMAVQGTSAKLHIQVHTDFLSPWFTKGGGFRSIAVRMPAINSARVKLAERVLPKAQGIRVVSERIKASLVARYGTRIVEPTVIPVAVSSTAVDSVPLPASFPFSLMTTGRLEPEKRIEDILMAVGRLKERYPSLGLIVVGDGSRRASLEKLSEKLGISERVVFTGWRTDAEGLLRSASAYIQASAYEGYSRTLIEAALAKVPIITTDVGIVGEVFRGYQEVLSAPVADPAALSVHIAGLIDDHQARLTFVMNAEQAAKAHLAQFANVPELIVRDLEAVLTRA